LLLLHHVCSKPPVCKLLDAGKAQYQAQLKEKVGLTRI